MQEAQEVSSLVKLLTSEAAWLIHKFVFLSGSRVLAGLSFHPLIHSFTDERSYVLFFLAMLQSTLAPQPGMEPVSLQ